MLSIYHSTLVALLATSATFFATASAETIGTCPGVINVNTVSGTGQDATICCVGGHLKGPVLSTCKGWPICSGSATTTVTPEPLSCATVITWTSGADNSAYSSLVSKASESLASSGTHFQTTLGATVGAAASSAGATASSSAAAGASSTPSASASTTQSSSNGSGAVMAQLGLVAAGVLAIAVLL